MQRGKKPKSPNSPRTIRRGNSRKLGAALRESTN
jgi:hypothetical protein